MPLNSAGRNERCRPVFAFSAFFFPDLNSRFFQFFDLPFLLREDCDQAVALYTKDFVTGDVDLTAFIQA
mgnify:CR=1 FL=1